MLALRPDPRKEETGGPETALAPVLPLRPSMWSYLSFLPIFLALWANAGVWIVFAVAVVNGSVNLTHGFPYISICGSYPPQSCIFSQVLNVGAAAAAWICIVRYYQLRDWGVRTWLNKLTLWSGLFCALGTSVVGNFQEKHQKPTHLVGAFLAFVVGNIYFWLQLLLSWRVKSLPQPGEPWIRPLRLGLCTLCSLLIVAMLVLHSWPLRSAAAACEWALAMLLFVLFGLFAVDFSGLDGCTLCLRPAPGPVPSPGPSPSPSPRHPRRCSEPASLAPVEEAGWSRPRDPQEEPWGLSSPRDCAAGPSCPAV
ncbi:modulator of macroautophagy TMEM150B [Fukomys damarensis]|uniref:modulator of macroautophagy TMEM150B n=1 Tax=Fukomys damarensis TaxID=885580 RepID=UPI00145534DF|nr:modulator of macroautophagy TMEM150B [Fukomys damarensis]